MSEVIARTVISARAEAAYIASQISGEPIVNDYPAGSAAAQEFDAHIKRCVAAESLEGSES